MSVIGNPKTGEVYKGSDPLLGLMMKALGYDVGQHIPYRDEASAFLEKARPADPYTDPGPLKAATNLGIDALQEIALKPSPIDALQFLAGGVPAMANMGRRGFLKFLGKGAATAAVTAGESQVVKEVAEKGLEQAAKGAGLSKIDFLNDLIKKDSRFQKWMGYDKATGDKAYDSYIKVEELGNDIYKIRNTLGFADEPETFTYAKGTITDIFEAIDGVDNGFTGIRYDNIYDMTPQQIVTVINDNPNAIEEVFSHIMTREGIPTRLKKAFVELYGKDKADLLEQLSDSQYKLWKDTTSRLRGDKLELKDFSKLDNDELSHLIKANETKWQEIQDLIKERNQKEIKEQIAREAKIDKKNQERFELEKQMGSGPREAGKAYEAGIRPAPPEQDAIRKLIEYEKKVGRKTGMEVVPTSKGLPGGGVMVPPGSVPSNETGLDVIMDIFRFKGDLNSPKIKFDVEPVKTRFGTDYNYTMSDGKGKLSYATVTPTKDGTEIYVQGLGLEPSHPSFHVAPDGTERVSMGVTGIKELFEKLKQDFPDAKYVTADRTTGASAKNVTARPIKYKLR